MLPTASFADTLRQQRLAHGLTQEELADRARLSARAISDLERGVKQTPRMTTVRLIVQALGLDSHEMAAMMAAARRHQPVGRKMVGTLATQLPTRGGEDGDYHNDRPD